VTLLIGWGTVCLVLGVVYIYVCSADIHGRIRLFLKRTVRTSAGAAIGVIAVGVDVHATLSAGIVAGNVP